MRLFVCVFFGLFEVLFWRWSLGEMGILGWSLGDFAVVSFHGGSLYVLMGFLGRGSLT